MSKRTALGNNEQQTLSPILLSKVVAEEKENNSKLEWILNNGETQDFEELLYNNPNSGLKAIGVKDLIRKEGQSTIPSPKICNQSRY